MSETMEWAKVDDSSEGPRFGQLIATARQAAEEYLRRALITQTWKLTLDQAASPFGGGFCDGVYDLPVSALYGGLPSVIELPKGPVQSVASVVTYDPDGVSTAFSATNYYLDTAGARLVLKTGATWPSNLRPIAACEITYVAGYGTAAAVPQPIKSGIMMHVASLYEQRGMCEDPTNVPPGARQLYNPYRIMGDRLG
ncbi:head-tail connector protein [Tundrisphaera lichenicola]|uniref:head-tail connector protein n=1 Tax=Tundrisphaera lichenicola TaxID=2029860 RepID=UPI003EB79E20